MIDAAAVDAFTAAARSGDDVADLARAALWIARVEHRGVDPDRYVQQLERMGDLAALRLSALRTDHDPRDAVDVLNEYLYDEEGFTGNRDRYDDPRNSFLNDVIDRRTGIPITLALVYRHVARRAGLPIEGVNFPGHFLLRWPASTWPAIHRGREGDLIIDPFHRGALLGEADCRNLLRQHTGTETPFDRDFLARAGKREILARMLHNLKRIYVGLRSFPQARGIVDLLLALDQSDLSEVRDRGLLSFHLHDFTAALRDLERYLRLSARRSGEEESEGREEHEQLWEHVKTLRRRIAGFN